MQLRSELAALQLSVQRAQTGAEAASAQATTRVREQAVQIDQQTVTLSRRLDALAATLTTLTARVEELGTRVEALNRQVRTATPSPTRPGPAVSAPAPTGGTPAAPAPPAAPALSPGAKPATGSLGPQDIYQAAYIDFSKGSYALAIAGFREFLRRYPEHELADNSQYWIGECNFSLARGYANAGQQERYLQSLELAVQEFKKVVANYPRGDKAPTALYKEALALLELKQPGVAQTRLQYLVDNFPQAEETQLARERLAALKEK